MAKGLLIPQGYKPRLDVRDTERGIKVIKDNFERYLAVALNLERVSAPLFVPVKSGLNDDLNGIERPVQFDIPSVGEDMQVVQSLAKWKRYALHKYHFEPGKGLYTDMNAIRRDEELDNIHSVYVDQWDWERVIQKEERNLEFLHHIVREIYGAAKQTARTACYEFPKVDFPFASDIYFITSQELEDRFPNLTPKQREDRICLEHGAVFVSQIGGKLKSGKPHDGRAPDYDDWQLNGDILVWNDVLKMAFEISSMGIRVDGEALKRQCHDAGKEYKLQFPFHQALLNEELPYTIGGGIGQSRLCMLMLRQAHIGEAQAGIWPQEVVDECMAHGIFLL